MEKTDVNNPYGPPIWPRFEELERVLEKWAHKHADLMKLEVRGKSLEGRPVYAVRLTHSDTDDSKKEHALITCLHSGVERSATMAAFYILEWFLSGNPVAANILTRQIVVIMPVPNPDCYEKGQHGWTYTEWNFHGPNHPDKMPEAVAVQQVIDEFQPEVHADIHGLSMDFEKYIMLENSGSAYSNFALRCYHHEIVRQMDAAALEEGYPSDHQESDSERMFWGPELDFMSEKLCVGRPRFYAATYCYYHYHTILSAVEVSWERSAFLRHRRLMQIGNEQWPGEYYPGYPYLKARIVDLKLNGKPLSHSATDGWLQFNARGYTYIQINIPPDKSKHEDLFVVTCQYHPGEQRSHWQGWSSPGNL